MSVSDQYRPYNVFSGAHTRRRAHKRRDQSWVESLLTADGTRIIAVWREHSLITNDEVPRAVLLRTEHLDQWGNQNTPPIFLGRFHDNYCFAVGLNKDRELGDEWGVFQNLHRVGSLLPSEDASLLAYARGMVLWHERHGYCNACGAATVSAEAGHIRQCTNPGCGTKQFPRVDPAVIVLAVDGERCLLGRQRQWPEGVYSTIAGFVEPGEGIEEAVQREVREETGVRVDSIIYHSSQPWPFPSSLMLGFTARAIDTNITRRDDELEDAQWFSRDDIAQGRLRVPSRVSIAYRLVEEWFDDGIPGRLRRILDREGQ